MVSRVLCQAQPTRQGKRPAVCPQGYNDFIDSSDLGEIAWPRTRQLAKSAIKLANYYTQPICTPTRGALMSGRYPVRLGLQHGVISGYQDYGERRESNY